MTGQSSYRLYSDLLYSLFNWFSGFLNVYGLFYLNLPEEGTLVFSDPPTENIYAYYHCVHLPG